MTREDPPQLSPSLGHRFNFREPVLIFVTCLAVYILFWSGHHYSIDGAVMFEYAKALLFKRSFFFEPPLMWGMPFETSKWPIGLTLLYIPVVWVLSLTIFREDPQISRVPQDTTTAYPPALLANRAYFYSSLVNPVLTALTAVVVYYMGLTLGLSKRKACAAALIFGLASPAATYARFDFAQPLASFLLMVALFFFIRAKRRPSWGRLVLSGVFLGLAILTRPEFLIVPGMVMIVLAFFISPSASKGSRWIDVGLFSLPVGLFVLLNQGINAIRFRGMFQVGYNLGDEFSFNLLHYGMAFAGNLVSPGRGIFLFFPLSLLGVVGLVLLVRRDRWLGVLLASVTLGMVVFYSAWKQWDAGLSWGPRFLIPSVPYYVLLALIAFNQLKRFRHPFFIGFTLLTILGGVASLQGMLLDFIEFYQSLRLSLAVLTDGFYNFNVAYSPLFMGWKFLWAGSRYDTVWVERGGLRVYLLFAMLLSFFVGGLAHWWVTYFAGKVSLGEGSLS